MPTLATFDVLDKELTRDVGDFLKIDDEYRWDNASVTFHLDQSYWEQFYAKVNKYINKMNWVELKYSAHHDLKTTIKSDDIGIYMFIIRPQNMILALPQFVMYVGISGEGDSKRPLRERLNDYFNINNIKKRKKLHSMLKKYYQNTWIVYSLINKITSAELEQLEEDFHGFFVPPANERDFPVKMKEIIKAKFTR